VNAAVPVPRAALITGADEPIGRAVTRALAADGWAVALQGADEATASAIAATGARAVALSADLTREAEVSELIPRAVAAVGTLGLLVNGATVGVSDLALTATRASWDRHIEANLRAPFVLMQAFARALPEDAEGVIVNILDRHGAALRPDFMSYAASMAGLRALTRNMALALAAGRGIRVNGIEPGAQPEDVAAAVRFILSAPSFTGQIIALDQPAPSSWAPAGARAVLEGMKTA